MLFELTKSLFIRVRKVKIVLGIILKCINDCEAEKPYDFRYYRKQKPRREMPAEDNPLQAFFEPLCVDQFVVFNFHSAIANIAHHANPLHLIFRFYCSATIDYRVC